MSTKPPASLPGHYLIKGPWNNIIYCLQFLSFVDPDVSNLFVGEVSAQDSDYHSHKFALVRVIKVVVVVISVLVVLGWQFDVFDVGDCSYLSSSLVEEHLAQVFEHQSPCYVSKSLD